MKLKKRFTKSEYQKKAEKILNQLKNEVKIFENDTPEKKKIRIAQAEKDIFFFAKTYFPHYFTKPFGKFHKDMNTTGEIVNEPVFLAYPRRFGKSTFFTFLKPLHKICFKSRNFILIISNTKELAADFAQFIQMEIEDNERLKSDFGDLVNIGNWSKDDFMTKNGVRIKSLGALKARGFRNRQFRPDYIVIDDMENDENVKNPQINKKIIDWLLTAVLGSVAENYNYIMIGTILSKKSVLSQMINMKMEDDESQPRFISRKYAAIKEDGTALWEEGWSLKALEKLKRQIGTARFNQDMMNDPKEENGDFQSEWFRTYNRLEIINKSGGCYTWVDPSSESGATNDPKAVVTVKNIEGIFYVVNAWIRQTSVGKMVIAMNDNKKEYQPLITGMEENAIGEFGRIAVKAETKEIHPDINLAITGFKNTTNKEERIRRLSVYVENGWIRFDPTQGDQKELLSQLEFFPSSNMHDDGPDALEGAIRLAEKNAGVIEFQSTGRKREHTRMNGFF